MDAQEIAQVLVRHRLVGIDSCVLIYYLEDHARFAAPAELVLRPVLEGQNEAVISTLALAEVQAGPYKRRAADRAELFYALLTRLPHVRWIPLTCQIADMAARLRGEQRLELADAVHVATCLETGAGLFVTNDRQLPPVPGIEYLVLR